MTTIGDVLSVARDMALEALDRGEPVAWLAPVRADNVLHTWVAIADRGGWFVAWWRRDGGVLSRCALGATWTTTTVRGRLLRAVCVVDPGPMVDRMTTALRARAEALRPDAPMPF